MSESNPSNTPNTTLPRAGLIRRLSALVYDSFLIFGITISYAGIILAVRVWVTGAEAAQIPYSGVPGFLFVIGLWFFPALFHSWCWHRSGQTLGMKTWRIKLLRTDGLTPTWSQCWLRSVLAPLSLVAFGVGYLWCLIGEKNCLHDLWTDTHVVVLPKTLK